MRQAASRTLALLCTALCACASSTGSPPTPPTASIPLIAAPPAPANDEAATFLDAPQLAQRLLHNLVRIDAEDIGEHGYGLIVGADEQQLHVVTARHVVARPGAGVARDIRVRPCAQALATRALPARLDTHFDPGREDLALLQVPRPEGYAPAPRALSPRAAVAPGTPAWLLGRDGDCVPVPVPGAIGSVVGNDVLVELKGVRGGSSGAPLFSGEGIFGLAKDSDEVIVIAHAIDHAMRLVREQRAAPWGLREARNIPPTDPRAAQIDLAETLNRYLFAVRDVHSLLLQPVVARPTFTARVATYNAAVERFRDAREKYDATLQQLGGPALATQWATLRERLWETHLKFFELNSSNAQTFQTERTTAAMRTAMQALEPQLVALERAIRMFLQELGQKGASP